jgi:aminoglycoside phosphotransferase (APT) family kinase protein
VDFRRRRPSAQTLDWVERVAGARVVAWRRMTGGIASVVHRLTIDHGSYRDVLVLRQQAPEPATCFIHRDFQHFNLLWRRGRLTGVVDWVRSCTGPADFDTGHCRLNLAVLFGADWAERLRLAYEAEAGRSVDPWWDLYAVTAYSDEWRRFIPVQVAGRAPVDTAGMTSRVEDLLEVTLGRL